MTRFALILTLLVLLVSCASPTQQITPTALPAETVAPTQPTVGTTTPVVTDIDISKLANGNSQFALALFKKLAQEKPGNIVFSPYSISLAIAMTELGARNATQEQIRNTLSFLIPDEELHAGFAKLQETLLQNAKNPKDQENAFYQLQIANALWGEKTYPIDSAYLASLEKNYGAGLRPLDFINSPEPSRLEINQWVTEQTKDKIKDLIPQNAIDSTTRLVLSNAVYLNAAWDMPFFENATAKGPFTLLDGSTVEADMMRKVDTLSYMEFGKIVALALPYKGQKLSMIVIVPEDINTFVNAFTLEDLTAIEAGLDSAYIDLQFPKFKNETDFSLAEVLKAMGMEDAFTDKADFSGISAAKDLFISSILHKAFIDVHELGTEAAAATAVIIGKTSAPADEPKVVKVDKPFVYLIKDNETKTILFMGSVLDPTKK